MLLQQRDEKPGIHSPGYWTLWGGRVEEGETPDQAIRRELCEELELVDVPLAWWRVYERPWRDGTVIEQHIYIAPFDRPAERLNLHEGQALRYFSHAELGELPIAFIFDEVLESFYEAGLDQITQDPRAIWEARYIRHASGSGPRCDAWLEAWLPEIERACCKGGDGIPSLKGACPRRVLDLGCGRSLDSRYLAGQGYEPVAADFSYSALRLASIPGAPASRVNLDLRHGLPFASGVFPVVIANLSLHYFPWEQTQAILEAVRACLAAEGLLLARFNSTNDANYGASGCQEIEPHAYLVNGMYKRFFDRADLERLFAPGWKVLHLEERTITRYSEPKIVWEIVSQRLGK